jgi:toxin-antitoxin system PIN domain toxin
MILTDVNVLVYAYREDAPNHSAYLNWLEDLIDSDHSYGYSDLVLSGFLRVVTHPRVFIPPSDLASALAFIQAIRDQPNAVPINPGPRHWDIFKSLCEAANVKGNMIPDAYLAALAIESGSEWISTDRDYSRFPSLKWRHPLEGRMSPG